MKKILLSLLIGLLIYACATIQTVNNKTRYFDENNIEIAKSEFEKIRATNIFLDIQGDSIHHKKLILRENRGKINNRPVLESFLEKKLNQKIDSTKPIVIIYYPGKDPCNSSGSTNVKSRVHWYRQLDEGVEQIAQTKPIYIYKDYEGLKKYDRFLNWQKDPEKTIERLFFNHHYPCNSFVVISENGYFISYFGEFSKEKVWNTTKIIQTNRF